MIPLPKTLLLTDADVFAGTERHILDLARALRDLDVPVAIGCPDPAILADKAHAAGIPVITVQKRGHIDFAAIRLLKSLLLSGQIDIIHAHNGRTHFAAARAVAAAGRGACITTQHFLSPTRTRRRGPKALLANALHAYARRRTAHTVAISDAVRHALLARRDAPAERVTTVHNGIYPPDLSSAASPDAVRTALHLPPGAPMILCAARLQTEKDIPTLLRAMAAVAQTNPAARCFIAGDGDLRESLDALLASLHLQNNVTLLGFRNDVPALLQACDLFVLPSLAEPFGLSIVEAMALAKPVIATDAGGPREIVDPGATGLLVPPADPPAMAAAIGGLLSDPAHAAAMGAAGRRRFVDRFTAQRMASDMIRIYEAASSPALALQPA